MLQLPDRAASMDLTISDFILPTILILHVVLFCSYKHN